MSNRILRPLLQLYENIFGQPKLAEAVSISSRRKAIYDCRDAIEKVQEKLHGTYLPMEAYHLFIRTTHPNIALFTAFLKRINGELNQKAPRLLLSDFPIDQTGRSLDFFFVAVDGTYIPSSAISEFVLQSNIMLDYADTLAQADSGIEEYHYRMLSKTIDSLTSIHGAISAAFAE